MTEPDLLVQAQLLREQLLSCTLKPKLPVQMHTSIAPADYETRVHEVLQGHTNELHAMSMEIIQQLMAPVQRAPTDSVSDGRPIHPSRPPRPPTLAVDSSSQPVINFTSRAESDVAYLGSDEPSVCRPKQTRAHDLQASLSTADLTVDQILSSSSEGRDELRAKDATDELVALARR